MTPQTLTIEIMGQSGWNPADRILGIGNGKGDAGVNFRPLTVQTGFLGGERPVAYSNAHSDVIGVALAWRDYFRRSNLESGQGGV